MTDDQRATVELDEREPDGSVRRVGWAVSQAPVEYADAVACMERRVAGIGAGDAGELVWLLQHPPLYTAGTSAREADLLDPTRFPVHRTGRGGQFTYHGPGQRIAYVMLDLAAGGKDVRAFVERLEAWIIACLAEFGVEGAVRRDRVGVWVPRPDLGAGHEDKIAAIGVRVRRWVTFHGLSLNVAPDLEHYSGIVPCGLTGFGVTSLAALGCAADMATVDQVLKSTFGKIFGPVSLVEEAAPV